VHRTPRPAAARTDAAIPDGAFHAEHAAACPARGSWIDTGGGAIPTPEQAPSCSSPGSFTFAAIEVEAAPEALLPFPSVLGAAAAALPPGHVASPPVPPGGGVASAHTDAPTRPVSSPAADVVDPSTYLSVVCPPATAQRGLTAGGASVAEWLAAWSPVESSGGSPAGAPRALDFADGGADRQTPVLLPNPAFRGSEEVRVDVADGCADSQTLLSIHKFRGSEGVRVVSVAVVRTFAAVRTDQVAESNGQTDSIKTDRRQGC
jgi:hypothetical protein